MIVVEEVRRIVALRNEKGSYSVCQPLGNIALIVALRNEKGSYSTGGGVFVLNKIVALRNEKGSYSRFYYVMDEFWNCSTAK